MFVSQLFYSFFQASEGSQLLLSACLSCDGCLSEDENVKISQQSLEEVKRVLALNKVHTCALQIEFYLPDLSMTACPLFDLTEMRCVEAQGPGGIDLSTVAAFLCC